VRSLHLLGPHGDRGLAALVWALCGVAAVLAIAVALLLDVDPSRAELAIAAIAVVATAVWVHYWRRLWEDERRA
jgi:hypothetical protein